MVPQGFKAGYKKTMSENYAAWDEVGAVYCVDGYVATSPFGVLTAAQFETFELQSGGTVRTPVVATSTNVIGEVWCQDGVCEASTHGAYGGTKGGFRMQGLCVESEKDMLTRGNTVRTETMNDFTPWSDCPVESVAIGIGHVAVQAGGVIDAIECEEKRCRARCSFRHCTEVTSLCAYWRGVVGGAVVAGGGEVVIRGENEDFEGGYPDEWSLWSQCPDGTRVIGVKNLTVHHRDCVSATVAAPTSAAAAAFVVGESLDTGACGNAGEHCLVVLNGVTLEMASATAYAIGALAGLVADLKLVEDGSIVMIGLAGEETLGPLGDAMEANGAYLEDMSEGLSARPTSRALVGTVSSTSNGFFVFVGAEGPAAVTYPQLCPAAPRSVNSVQCDNSGIERHGCRAFCMGRSCSVQVMCLPEVRAVVRPMDPDQARHRRRRTTDHRRQDRRRMTPVVTSLTELEEEDHEKPEPPAAPMDPSARSAEAEVASLQDQLMRRQEEQAEALRLAMEQYSRLAEQAKVVT